MPIRWLRRWAGCRAQPVAAKPTGSSRAPAPISLRMVSIFASRACGASARAGTFKDRRVDRVQGAGAHRFKDFRRVVVDVGGDDHDGAGRAGHDAARGFDPIHSRHDQIHQDEVRRIAGAKFKRLGAVVRDPGELMFARAEDHAAHRFDRRHHVVDQRDSHASGSPIKSTTACSSVSSWKLPLVR